MDQIQKTLIKAGRKDLAQKYYKKITGADSPIKTILDFLGVFGEVDENLVFRKGSQAGPRKITHIKEIRVASDNEFFVIVKNPVINTKDIITLKTINFDSGSIGFPRVVKANDKGRMLIMHLKSGAKAYLKK